MAASQQTRLTIFATVKDSHLVESLPHRDKQILSAWFENALIATLPYDFFKSQEFIDRVIAWCSLAGIRDMPDVVSEAFLIESLMYDFGSYSLAEIDVAIKMNVMGEFDPEIEAYNQFNVKFLSRVMRAYKIKRKDLGNKFNDIYTKLEAPKKKELTALELDTMTAQSVLNQYYDFLNGEDVFGGSIRYDFLKRINAFPEFLDDWLTAFEAAKELLNKRYVTSTGPLKEKLATKIADLTKFNLTAETIAKELLYLKYLTYLKENNIPVSVLLDDLELHLRTTHLPNMRVSE